MKVNLGQLGKYIVKKYGGKTYIVHIFDKSVMSSFNLSGEMMINMNTAYMLARVFIAISPFIVHPDIEFDDPNK